MKIILEPSNTIETFKDVQFRLFKGIAGAAGTPGIPLHMLGMFRINDALERAKFVAMLTDAVQHQDQRVMPLAGTLITGAEDAVKKRRELTARALLAVAKTAHSHPAADFDAEGMWAQFLPIADTLLAEMEKAR